MKYSIYEITVGTVRMYCYALTSNSEWHSEKKVGEANTAKEAEKKVKDLGEIELVK